MKIIGHLKTMQYLQDLISHSRLPHALLFTGPAGIGKKQVALHFVQMLLCQASLRPCEECVSCKRVAALQDPDLHWIEPEKEAIKIESIRNLKKELALKAYAAPLRIAVIVDAHCLNAAASNALLKTLEEPPPNTLILLTTSAPYLLLKTLLSRCQKVYFSPLSLAQTRQVLQSQELERKFSSELIEQASGSPGLALSLPEEAYELMQNTLLPALSSQPKDMFTLLLAAEEVASNEELHQPLLHLLQLQWRKKVVEEPNLQNIKKFDHIHNASQSLEHNANPLLTFENLFLNLCL